MYLMQQMVVVNIKRLNAHAAIVSLEFGDKRDNGVDVGLDI
jgi:hypothetical protein